MISTHGLRAPLARTLTLILAASASSVALGQTSDPLPGSIDVGGAVAFIEPFAEIPESDGQAPRMNLLAPAYDGSGRVFVNDQRGPMYAISEDGETVDEYLNLADIVPQMTDGFEGGFQSFAFHPEFADNGKLYTLHGTYDTAPAPTFNSPSDDAELHMVLLEWTDSDPASNSYEGELPREVFRVEQAINTHYGGGLTFNYGVETDHEDFGRLYVTVGDGGEPEGSQNPAFATGSVLRIDPLGDDSRNGRYGVPDDNPFVGDADVLPEVWAYGLRNPQRISFDIEGEVEAPFISDIGQGTVEEINLGFAGDNYGWPDREGSFELFDGGSVIVNDADPLYTNPLAEYDHDEGAAVTGGWLVRGEGPEALEGQYVFGDIPTGRIFYVSGDVDGPVGQEGILELTLLDEEGELTSVFELVGNERADLRLGVGEEGRVFVLNKHDGVVRVLTDSFTIPEPTTLPLAALSVIAIGFVTMRRRKV